MFKHVFALVKQITNENVKWQHIHEADLYEIVMNINKKQMYDMY